MIISASRRTDIPAFYSEWFVNRIRDGYCCVVNPFNRKQIKYVSLKPEDVSVVVFWTKNAKPLIPFLDELDERGLKYYFHYTVTGYAKEFEPETPSLEEAIKTISSLSNRIGKDKIIWRYDPIIFTNITSFSFHRRRFEELADNLKEYTERVVVSIFDEYRGSKTRMERLKRIGIDLIDNVQAYPEFEELFVFIAETSKKNKLEVFSCADEIVPSKCGIPSGKCIDDNYINKIFGICVPKTKDKSQRKECLCVLSTDIGFYDTCLHGCEYCYATRSKNAAKKNFLEHNNNSPSLIGWFECGQMNGNMAIQTNMRYDDYE